MLPFLVDSKQLNAAVLKAIMVAVVYPVLLVNTVAVVQLVIMEAAVQQGTMVAAVLLVIMGAAVQQGTMVIIVVVVLLVLLVLMVSKDYQAKLVFTEYRVMLV